MGVRRWNRPLATVVRPRLVNEAVVRVPKNLDLAVNPAREPPRLDTPAEGLRLLLSEEQHVGRDALDRAGVGESRNSRRDAITEMRTSWNLAPLSMVVISLIRKSSLPCSVKPAAARKVAVTNAPTRRNLGDFEPGSLSLDLTSSGWRGSRPSR